MIKDGSHILLARIWGNIKRLFDKKEMEIEETINKWLVSLDDNLRNVNNKDDQVYNYCLLVNFMIRDYSTSILQLSKQNKELPAKVMLRTLAELAIKFCWCMKDAHKNIEKFYSKAECWAKNSLSEQQKFLKRSIECFNDVRICSNLKENKKYIKEFDTKGVKNLPDNAELCRQLFKEESSMIYMILFGQLHEVVHSNLFLLQRLKISDDKIFDSESDDSTVLSLMCLACIYLVIKYIYEFYGVEFSSIESDYSRLKN